MGLEVGTRSHAACAVWVVSHYCGGAVMWHIQVLGGNHKDVVNRIHLMRALMGLCPKRRAQLLARMARKMV